MSQCVECTHAYTCTFMIYIWNDSTYVVIWHHVDLSPFYEHALGKRTNILTQHIYVYSMHVFIFVPMVLKKSNTKKNGRRSILQQNYEPNKIHNKMFIFEDKIHVFTFGESDFIAYFIDLCNFMEFTIIFCVCCST